MEIIEHSVNNLFAQLGLPNDNASIQHFIRLHWPLSTAIDLHAASFWTPSQATLLCESLRADSDWAMAVDQLNTRLRATPLPKVGAN